MPQLMEVAVRPGFRSSEVLLTVRRLRHEREQLFMQEPYRRFTISGSKN